MISFYIANFIMRSPKISKEELIKTDRERGFADAIDDYNKKWDRNPFSLKSGDAIIRGEYITNSYESAGPKKVVIIAHGITAAKEADIKYAKLFYELGYNIVIFDERYFGDSTGKYCTLGMKESEDIKRVCDYAKTVFGADSFLGLHGESMGAASVLKMLDTYKPDFVVADCPFSDLEMLIKEVARKSAGIIGTAATYNARLICLLRGRFDFFKVKPIKSVRNTNVPICFIHGDSDSLINCAHSKRMFELCRNRLSELHIFKNTDHAVSVTNDRERYTKIIKEFIRNVEDGRFDAK